MGGSCVKVVVSHLHFMHILIARRAENLPRQRRQSSNNEDGEEERGETEGG